jgi:hypothetical protein
MVRVFFGGGGWGGNEGVYLFENNFEDEICTVSSDVMWCDVMWSEIER